LETLARRVTAHDGAAALGLAAESLGWAEAPPATQAGGPDPAAESLGKTEASPADTAGGAPAETAGGGAR